MALGALQSLDSVPDDYLFRLEVVSHKDGTARLFSKAAGAYVRWAPHKTKLGPLFRIDVRAFSGSAAAVEETFAMRGITPEEVARSHRTLATVRQKTKEQVCSFDLFSCGVIVVCIGLR